MAPRKSPQQFTLPKKIEEELTKLRNKKLTQYEKELENERIVELLEDINVDYLQGYHIGKPQPWDTFF